MRAFAQQQNAPQRSATSSLTRSNTPASGPQRADSIPHVKRAIGNQAVRGATQTAGGEREVGSTGTASPHPGHDFSRIPLHSPPAGATQTKLAVNESGDARVQEAERASLQATRTPGPRLQRKCACGSRATAGGECEECREEKRFGLQTKLTVNEPGDVYEREADRVADQMLVTSERPTVGGAPLHIQRFTAQPTGQMEAAPTSVDQALASPGKQLEPALRQDMEQRFGRDFSRVRVHSGAAAEQSARDVNARAYTVGGDVVFAAGQFAPGTHAGRRLLAHELTHVVQQGGEGNLIQRAPVNYPSNDPSAAQTGPKLGSPAKKPEPQLSADDWIWVLVTLRRESPQRFVRILITYESQFYPILKPYGFQGSWVKEQGYLDDFDAAVLKWGKSHIYSLRFAYSPRTASPQKPKSREEQKYEYAQYLVRDMNRHGYGRGKTNDALASYGLMDDLVAHGFEKHDRWSFKNHEEYKYEAIRALNEYIGRYQVAHDIKIQTSANVPTQGEDIEFYRAWLEGWRYVTSSFTGALFANTASKFTSDPKKITAAAGAGAALEGAVGTAVGAWGGGGGYRPEVVGPRDRPAAVGAWRYTGKQPTKPVADPAKVNTPPAAPPPKVDTPPVERTEDLPAKKPPPGPSTVTKPSQATPRPGADKDAAQIGQWIGDAIEGLPQPGSTPLAPASSGRGGPPPRPVVSSISAVDISDLTTARRAALEAGYPGYVTRTQAKIKAGTRSPKSLLSRDNYVRLRHGFDTRQLGSSAQRPRPLGAPGAIEQEAGHVLEKVVDARLPAGSSNTGSFPNPYGDPVIPDHLPPGTGEAFIDPKGRHVQSGGIRFSARYVGDSKYRGRIPVDGQTRGFVNLARLSDERTLVFYVKWQDTFPAANTLAPDPAYGGRVLPVRPWNENLVAPGLREFARARKVRIRLVSDPQWR